jgi:hypothetical protein
MGQAMVEKHESPAKEIADLRAEIESHEDISVGLANAGTLGVNRLPDTIRRLRADLAAKVAELEALDASRP